MLAGGPVIQPVAPGRTDFADVDSLVEEPPEPVGEAGLVDGVAVAGRAPAPRKVDFVRRDAENRRLGRQGEEWVIECERRRLHDREKRPDLAKRLIWVSDAEGDGAGYDIRSFNGDESPRLIDVKTAGLGKHFPFLVTPNELAVSEREPIPYHLYRVFDFGRRPRMYQLNGALSATCRLKPAQYSAVVAHSQRP